MRAGPSRIIGEMRRRPLPFVLVIVVALAGGWQALSAGGDGGSSGGASAGDSATATVVRVTDGDTIRVRVGGKEERVRYIGVDTPESVKPDTPVQCFAKKASDFNKSLVAGRQVRLVQDVEARDRYGRLLAYVYRKSDGLFVNAELVRRGYARTLTIPPNVRFAKRFSTLARQAREDGKGLWSAC